MSRLVRRELRPPRGACRTWRPCCRSARGGAQLCHCRTAYLPGHGTCSHATDADLADAPLGMGLAYPHLHSAADISINGMGPTSRPYTPTERGCPGPPA